MADMDKKTARPNKRMTHYDNSCMMGLGKSGTCVLALALLMTMISCGRNESPVSECKSPMEALKNYEGYLDKLPDEGGATEELINVLKNWMILDDSVNAVIGRNCTHQEKAFCDSVYLALRDSIMGKIIGYADLHKRTLKDYLDIITAVIDMNPDSLFHGIIRTTHQFYTAMDTVPTFGLNNEETIRKYRQILKDTMRKGFEDKQDVLIFLRQEDRAFRSFLECLSVMGDIPLEEVRDMSSSLVKQIVMSGQNENPLLTTEEIVVLLTMRNNRRLLQNALQCVNDINSHKVSGTTQASAYMWMLLQPWLSFDGFSYSLMSEEQIRALYVLADETSECTVRLGSPEFPLDVEELPGLLIRTLITNL